MSYTVKYTENGEEKIYTITAEESEEAVANDYIELKKFFNPNIVKIAEQRAAAGEALHLGFTVYAPSHYLSSPGDKSPKGCEMIEFEMIVYSGYPAKKVLVRYHSDKYLASPNVWCSGTQCIDTWVPTKCSLATTAEKVVRDIIHDSAVNRYDSPANSDMIRWHKDNVAAGNFPTIAPNLIYKPKSNLPPRRADTGIKSIVVRPVERRLPPRRH